MRTELIIHIIHTWGGWGLLPGENRGYLKTSARQAAEEACAGCPAQVTSPQAARGLRLEDNSNNHTTPVFPAFVSPTYSHHILPLSTSAPLFLASSPFPAPFLAIGKGKPPVSENKSLGQPRPVTRPGRRRTAANQTRMWTQPWGGDPGLSMQPQAGRPPLGEGERAAAWHLVLKFSGLPGERRRVSPGNDSEAAAQPISIPNWDRL